MMDKKISHSPGPWKYVFESLDPEWAVVTMLGGHIVANVNADYRKESNARLIAAAPDLLEALKRFVDDGLVREHASGTAITRARAAIAKATGEKQ